MIQTKKIIKKDCLMEMERKLNITVDGIENYPCDDEPTFVVANHSCLMDIFYLAMGVPESHASIISSRLLYKNEMPRKKLIQNSLYAMPMEPMSGVYSKIAIQAAAYLLSEGISLSIFPEGMYNGKTCVSRGRTGMARILALAISKGVLPHFVPVAIDAYSKDEDINRYTLCSEDEIHVQILKTQNYERLMWMFYRAQDYEERNSLLHQMVDMGMREIADSLGLPFLNRYIPVSPKENVMYENGSVLSFEEAGEEENIERYKSEVMNRARRLVRELK